jgi:sugar phosphate isomerase/epimerase
VTDEVRFSVFTKPWQAMSIEQLGTMVHRLGFDGIELPVRPGFPVNPDNVRQELAKAVKMLAQHNVKVYSVAGAVTAEMIAACASAAVPTLRIMAPIGPDGYTATEARFRKELDAAVPLLERHGVRVGVQNHCGRYVCNAAGLRALIGPYDPKLVGAVWDAAHNALQGEEPELAIEIVWPHLCMVNLKNAVWRRKNPPDQPLPEWTPYWTTGREGLASWTRVAAELSRRNYAGVVCLTAEYSEEAHVDRYIADDLSFARQLFGGRS